MAQTAMISRNELLRQVTPIFITNPLYVCMYVYMYVICSLFPHSDNRIGMAHSSPVADLVLPLNACRSLQDWRRHQHQLKPTTAGIKNLAEPPQPSGPASGNALLLLFEASPPPAFKALLVPHHSEGQHLLHLLHLQKKCHFRACPPRRPPLPPHPPPPPPQEELLLLPLLLPLYRQPHP